MGARRAAEQAPSPRPQAVGVGKVSTGGTLPSWLQVRKLRLGISQPPLELSKLVKSTHQGDNQTSVEGSSLCGAVPRSTHPGRSELSEGGHLSSAHNTHPRSLASPSGQLGLAPGGRTSVPTLILCPQRQLRARQGDT